MRKTEQNCPVFSLDTRFTAGGIAYMYPSAPQSGISVIFDLGTLYTPYAIQHEISHNYGLPHDALLESHRNWYGF
ncbi:M12 family metallo-peptidase [Bacillus thuringiensis]